MNEKSEALQLADALDECKYVDAYQCKQAAAELRRLHAECQRLAAEVANRNRRALDGDIAVTALENTHAHYEGLEAELYSLNAEVEALRDDAERYQWLVTHPNEWQVYRKHGKHKRPFRMMRDGAPWGNSFATPAEAIDTARRGTTMRCPLCSYQHGHAIGCGNNPVDQALGHLGAAARDAHQEKGQ